MKLPGHSWHTYFKPYMRPVKIFHLNRNLQNTTAVVWTAGTCHWHAQMQNALRFEEFGVTVNWSHARRPRPRIITSGFFIFMIASDKPKPLQMSQSGLFNRCISPETTRLRETNICAHCPRRGLYPHCSTMTTPHMGKEAHPEWMSSLVKSHVSCFTEQMGGSRVMLHGGAECWHHQGSTLQRRHTGFGSEYSMDIAHNCMSLLTIWMLSDTQWDTARVANDRGKVSEKYLSRSIKNQWILWELCEKLDLTRSQWKVSGFEKGLC